MLLVLFNSLSRRLVSPFLLAVTLFTAAGCTASRIEVETGSDHSFVDVAYDDTHFNMLVRKDTIDRNDNNVLFWGVNNMFAPTFDPARQSLYFSLESNYRDERDRYYMEWNLDSRGTAGAKHRLIHGMIPKDNGYGQLLELRWNRYLFKKAYGDTEYLSIAEDGMHVNTPILRGGNAPRVFGNTVTVNWDDGDVFTVDLPAQNAKGFDAEQPVLVQFQGKNAQQTISLYLFSGTRAQRLRWADEYEGARMMWKDGKPVDLVPPRSVAAFSVSRVTRPDGSAVYLASLEGMYAQ